MPLNESIVEDAALTWFGELGYAVGHGRHLVPGEPAAERNSFGEEMLVGRLSDALRQLNSFARSFHTLATVHAALLPKLLSGEMSMARITAL